MNTVSAAIGGGWYRWSLVSVLAAPLLVGCGGAVSPSEEHPVQMYDCLLGNNGSLHLHLSELRGTASVISRYRRGLGSSHSQDLLQGRESEGRLIQKGNDRHAIELFLLNDHFGERPGELVSLRIAPDGRSRIEARRPGGQSRIVDAGSCSAHQHRAGTG